MWPWDEWPGRSGTDAGIDLVAEDREVKLWAIQAKAYHEATWITKRDADTFLAESGRPQLLVHLGQARRQQVEFRSEFLKLAKVSQ